MRRRSPLRKTVAPDSQARWRGEPEAVFTATRARIGTSLPPGGNHSLRQAAWANLNQGRRVVFDAPKKHTGCRTWQLPRRPARRLRKAQRWATATIGMPDGQDERHAFARDIVDVVSRAGKQDTPGADDR